MGNGVGKIVGVIAGAAASFIPGVGPLAAGLIFAGTNAIGGTIDALVDDKKQNDAFDAAAEQARQEAARQAEAARVAARRELENQQRQNNENRATAEMEVENQRVAGIVEAERLEAEARIQQQQINLVEHALAACIGDFNQIPGLLIQMDDAHFALFRERGLAVCETADAQEACRIAIEHEEIRRNVANAWEAEINRVNEPQANPRPANRPRV